MVVLLFIYISVLKDMAGVVGVVRIRRGGGGGGEKGRRVGGGKECRVDGKRGMGEGRQRNTDD